MGRVKSTVASRKRRKKVLKAAKGFRGGRGNLIRQAYGAVDRAMAMAYVGRKQKKQQYRRLWTIRINAACRAENFNYSQLIDGLHKAGIEINRKWLADLCITDPEAFSSLVQKARTARS